MTMRRFVRCLVGLCCIPVVGAAACVSILAQSFDPVLTYAARGTHWEGLRSIPIAGTVELVSARVATDRLQRAPTPAIASGWGDRARLRFYLPRGDRVTVTVRMRSGSTYYVLDRVTADWKTGALNEYAWPTATVIRKLTDVRPDDLGAVVNLGAGKNSNRETVLPVVLFDDAVDGGPKTYRFTLKTDGRANVNAVVYAGTREVFRRPRNWEEAGSAFTVVWSASAAAEGWYRLVLTGQFEDGTNVDKEVNFYHGPVTRTGGGLQ